MNPRSRRTGFLGYSLGPSSYSYYPSYFGSPYYNAGGSSAYSGYSSYSRSGPSSYLTPSSTSYSRQETRSRTPVETPSYQGTHIESNHVTALRRKSMEVSSMAKEASVTRELYKEHSISRETGARDKDFTPARDSSQPIPPPRYKRWASSASLAQPSSSSSSSYLPDWVQNSSSRFSKATASLYQKSRGALGILRSSSLFDLRGSTTDVRGSNADLTASTSNLRGSTSNLRGSISNLRELRNSRQDISTVPQTPKSQRDKARRQTTQVSELDLSRARSWQGSYKDLQEGKESEREWDLGRRGSLVGRVRSIDLGYSSPGPSRRSSCGRDTEEREERETRDYKKLWEESQVENAKLRLEMDGIREELEDTRRRLQEALMGAAEREDFRERLEMEERVKIMEREIKELRTLREENEELKTQNSSLSHAISKMSAAVRKTTRV